MAVDEANAERAMGDYARDLGIGCGGMWCFRGREVEVALHELQVWGDGAQELVGRCISQVAET